MALASPGDIVMACGNPHRLRSWTTDENPAGCSKRPFSKAAASCHFIRGGWDDPNCAQHSHPPTHWQTFFTRPTLRLLRNRFPGTCHLPGRGPSDSPTSPEGLGRLFFTARIERPPLYRGGSASKKNGLPAPSHPSEAARCVSKGIVPATPSPLFQHPAT
jgi:hypothetical protein